MGLPVVAVALINNLFAGVLFGIFKLIFGIVVVVYCLGPSNFWSQFYVYAAAIHKDDAQAAVENAKSLFELPAFANPQEFHRALTSALFIAANNRIFAVIFWYILLGPAGAVLYRPRGFIALKVDCRRTSRRKIRTYSGLVASASVKFSVCAGWSFH